MNFQVFLSCGSRLHLYADDVLYSIIEAHPAALIHVQNDISRIAQLSIDNSLILNCPMFKYMILSRKKSTVSSTPLLSNGQPLAHVMSTKYIGVMLTNNLSWSEHVNSVLYNLQGFLSLYFENTIFMIPVVHYCSYISLGSYISGLCLYGHHSCLKMFKCLLCKRVPSVREGIMTNF